MILLGSMNASTFVLRDELIGYIEEEYGVKPEHLWEQYPEYLVDSSFALTE